MNDSDERAFRQVEASAAVGARCPTRDVLVACRSNVLARLARAGWLRIDVYPHNFRVATILQGPHKGKHTRLPTQKHWKPYLTIGPETEA